MSSELKRIHNYIQILLKIIQESNGETTLSVLIITQTGKKKFITKIWTFKYQNVQTKFELNLKIFTELNDRDEH